jgi:polar amino acid transport system permease protein
LWDSLAALQFGANGWGDELARGLANTLLLSFCALPLGLIGGLLLAFAAHSRQAWLSEPAAAFAGVFRGVPELLTLFIVYFGGQRILNLLSEGASSAGTIEFNSFLAGSITLGLVFAAYASEVFLGILRTLDRSCLEAARALAIGRWPTLRYILVPELFRLGLPGLSNLWLSVLKQSALVSAISGGELMHAGYLAASSTGDKIFFYGIVCIAYIGVTMASEALVARFHRRLSRGRAHA